MARRATPRCASGRRNKPQQQPAHYNRTMSLFSIASSPVILQCKGILFDMDGILISSLGSVERSWSKWANLRGVDTELAVGMAHGRRAVETIAGLRPDLDAEAE